MIALLYTNLVGKFDSCDPDVIRGLLPPELGRLAEKYRRPDDQIRSLASKYLLLKALELFGISGPYRYIAETARSKPILEGVTDFSFNITHSANIVICAASDGAELGVDAEQVRPAPDIVHRGVFTQNELELLQRDANDPQAYLRLWTRKEALSKADGRGMRLQFRETDATENSVEVGDMRYAIVDIHGLPDGYVGALAYAQGEAAVDIELREVPIPSI